MVNKAREVFDAMAHMPREETLKEFVKYLPLLRKLPTEETLRRLIEFLERNEPLLAKLPTDATLKAVIAKIPDATTLAQLLEFAAALKDDDNGSKAGRKK